MADLMGLLMKSGGLNMAQLLSQAAQLGTMFERIAANQEALLLAMAEQREGQLAIMATLGIYVPPPSGDQADIIALETQKLLAPFGGVREIEASDVGLVIVG